MSARCITLPRAREETTASRSKGCAPSSPRSPTARRRWTRTAPFPSKDVAALEAEGLLRAPLPRGEDGLGWGTAPEGAAPLSVALRLIGRANLSLGRLYEGHVNAVRLVLRRGNPVASPAGGARPPRRAPVRRLEHRPARR